MEDRFRFRAWDKSKNVMVYPGDKVGFLQNEEIQNGQILQWFEDEDIMQCTGLKDKNGALIYEGDIVTYPDKRFKIKKCWLVEYNGYVNEIEDYVEEYSYSIWDYYICSPLHKGVSTQPLYTMFSNVVVVGNCHENPELLEENKLNDEENEKE